MSRPAATRIQGIYPLADDDPRWRHGPRPLLQATLRGGARVVQLRLKHTPDREALELIRWAAEQTRSAGALLIVNDRYDLVILDQTMSRMTGLEMAQHLLKLRPGLPVVLYTGYSDEISETQVRQRGIRALVNKPVDASYRQRTPVTLVTGWAGEIARKLKVE